MLKKIVLDLETQDGFSPSGRRGNLKISVCGIYDYAQNKYLIYEQHELPKLAPLLQSADQIIGFNSRFFDMPVLQPYISFDLMKIPHLDLLEEVSKNLGRRLSLDTLAQGTLGKGKSGKGWMAPELFKQGRMEELKKYCLDDVRITKEVYEYGLKNGKLLYNDFFSVKEVPVQIQEPRARMDAVRQDVLF